MPERTSYTPGTPSWTDLSSPDLDASAAFYGGLFGWECHETGTIEETGGYRMFTKNGKSVAGMGPLQEDQPTMWGTYFSVDDADAVTKKVEEAGGQVYMPPMDVLTAGRMAVYADPQGAIFCVWQPGDHIGCELVNEHGTLTWNELAARDPEAANPFYANVFGWEENTREMDHGPTYTEWKFGEQPLCGMLPMAGLYPDEVPSFWLTYFWVDDVDAAVAKAEELGGKSMMVADIEPGRMAMLTDPQGATFALIKPSWAAS